MRMAFKEWQAFAIHTQIAESAFNKLLEINHQHSRIRFHVAMQMLHRVAKKVA